MMDVRPSSLSEIIGQDRAKAVLKTLVDSAKIRNAPVPHILLLGSSGFGKTTIAKAIAHDRGVHCHVYNAAQFTTVVHMDRIIKKIRKNDCIFLDEIHRLNDRLTELLYTVMEDFEYCSEYKKYSVPPCTFIGATTLLGDLLAPFKGRFKFAVELERYEIKDLVEIVNRVSKVYGFQFKKFDPKKPKTEKNKDSNIQNIIAKMSRGTPRNVVNNTEFLYHWMIANKENNISDEKALEIIKMTGVDEEGLRTQDRKYLNIVRRNGPIGINSIAGKMSMDKETIMTDIEPYLMQINKLIIQPNGRVVPFDPKDLEDLMGELV